MECCLGAFLRGCASHVPGWSPCVRADAHEATDGTVAKDAEMQAPPCCSAPRPLRSDRPRGSETGLFSKADPTFKSATLLISHLYIVNHKPLMRGGDWHADFAVTCVHI